MKIYQYKRFRRQRGMVSVIALMVLVSIVTLIAIMTLRVADTGVNDSLNQSSSVAALFLAESGLEYATKQLNSGAESCGAMATTAQSFGRGSFSIVSSTSTDYDGVTALPAGECRVQVSGTVTNTDVMRTVQGVINYTGGASTITQDVASTTTVTRNNDYDYTFSVTVSTGSNQLLVVGVVNNNAASQTVSGVYYDGALMSRAQAASNGANVEVELWYQAGLTAGSHNVHVTLTPSTNTGMVMGAIVLNGVDQTSPLEGSGYGSGHSTAASLSTSNITTTTDNDWVVDVLGVLRDSPTPSAGAGQSLAWNSATGGNPASRIRGLSSTLGPKSPPGTFTTNWSWSGSSLYWAMVAAAFKPATSTGIGVLSWRE